MVDCFCERFTLPLRSTEIWVSGSNFFFFFLLLAVARPLAVAMLLTLPTVIPRGKPGGGGVEMLSVSALNTFQNVQSN